MDFSHTLKLNKTREQIDNWFWNNYKELSSPEYYACIDNNGDTPEMFNSAKLRVLIVFISSGKVRGVSNTPTALRSLVKQKLGNDVFVDFSYLPYAEDEERFIKDGIPFWFGNVSHAPVQDYDILMVSHSIIPEILDFPRALS